MVMSVITEIYPAIARLIIRLIQIISTQILALIYGGQTSGIPTPKSSILMESATSLANRIRNGKVTSYEVVRTFINRIKEVNDILNCVVDSRFEEALEEAKKVDELIASGSLTKDELEKEMPFLGVPFTTKDSIAVAGLVNSAGIKARKDVKAEKDAEIVRLMRKAGGIPLAITNVSELCFWWETNNPNFGKTYNPYNLNRTTGGSSGGEACVLTSCASPIGIGSDIGGSVRIPAAFSGIFGHKPSGEITPLDGLFPKVTPVQATFNTVGPMSRFSEDLLPALKVMTSNSNVDLKLDEEVDIKKLKYYYMEDDGGGNFLTPVDQEVKSVIKKFVEHLKRSYGIVAQKVNLSKMKYSHEIWMTKMTSESDPQLSALLTNNEGRINIIKEMLKAPFRLSDHTMATLFMAFMEEMNASSDKVTRVMKDNLFLHLKKEIQELLGEEGVFLYPTQPNAANYHYESLFKPFNYAYTGIFNVLGLPATHCPMGMNSEGLPIGFQVIAGRNQDRLTMAVAREIDQTFGGWKPSPTAGRLVLKNRNLIQSGRV